MSYSILYFFIFSSAILCHFKDEMMKTKLVGIAGASGSGKTTIAAKIHEYYLNDSVIISCDDYYKDFSHLSQNEALKINFDHPDSLDLSLIHI